MKRIYSFFLLFGIAYILSACTANRSVVTPSLTLTSLASSTAMPLTSISTPTATLTPSPVLTVTSSSSPTLTSEEARETIRTLLEKPVDCEAPCFWGIIPGQTTLDKAEDTFTYFGLQSKSTSYEGKDFYGIRDDLESGLSIIVTLTVQDKIVKNLRVDIVPEIQKVGVSRKWLAYSPDTLIERYGPPSKVEFALDWGPRPYFEMDMYFDKVDLIVVYEGHNIIPREKGSSRVCPLTAQFEAVRLWMGKDPYQPPREAVPLEKASAMTLEEFANLMTGDPGKACFVVNGEAFK